MASERILLSVLALLPVWLILNYTSGRAGRSMLSETVGEAFAAGAVISFGILGAGFILRLAVSATGFELGGGILASYSQAFVKAAIPEETGKLLLVTLFAIKHPEARKPGDIVLASVCVALGFAAVENLFYVLGSGQRGSEVAFLRAVTAVPAHACFGMLMGAALTARATAPSRKREFLALAWLGPVLLHGVYNAAAMRLFAPRPALGGSLVQGQLTWMTVLALIGLCGVAALSLVCRHAEPARATGSRFGRLRRGHSWIVLGGLYAVFGAFVGLTIDSPAVQSSALTCREGQCQMSIIALELSLLELSALVLPLILGGSMILHGAGVVREAR